MANHKSSLKRIRQEEKRRLHNRYYAKTMRNAVRKLRATTEKAAAIEMYKVHTEARLRSQTSFSYNGTKRQLFQELPFLLWLRLVY